MTCVKSRRRESGILLHPTSLPGPYGIGDLGPDSYRWIEWLASSGGTLWQILPLGPTGFGDSPYQCFSAFAGNPFLISPALLLEDDLLREHELPPLADTPQDRVDFGSVIDVKQGVLHLATQRFRSHAPHALLAQYEEFCSAQKDWLTDYALFMALKQAHAGAPWVAWEADLARREETALRRARKQLSQEVEDQRIQQFLFLRQWSELQSRAHERGLRLIGDIPIFVAHDSADVWSHPELFFLDDTGNPTKVAGVPPDYFSPLGQRWGNPLYRWEVLRADGFSWWVKRFLKTLTMVDLVRLDHFRGFVGYWEVPADAPTAESGRWVSGPGAELLQTLEIAAGGLPIIAEDLGLIDPDVVALRDLFGLPGMKILQFGFEGGPEHEFVPHNHGHRFAVYTGTHDNDTAHGWFERAAQPVRDFCRRYLSVDGHDIAWDLIRCAWASVAEIAIAPMQDVLSLGGEARMNFPSRAEGNWTWRVLPEQLSDGQAARLLELNTIYGRRRTESEASDAEPSAQGG